MHRLQAYKFRIEPTGAQERLMQQFAGMSRFIYNKALAIQLEEQNLTGKKKSGYAALCKQLTSWRNDPETSWLEIDHPSLKKRLIFESRQTCLHP